MPARPSKDEVVARAKAAWPQLQLDDRDFLTWLSHRAHAEGEPNIEDLWLVRACELNVKGALLAFERTALKPALLAIPPASRDDVGQRVLQRLFTGPDPKIRQYRGRGRLSRWLEVVALREGRTERRVAARERPEEDLSQLAGAMSQSGVTGLDRALHGKAKDALAAALESLGEDERRLMARHFLEGVTHQALATELGIPRSTVAYRLTRLTQRVMETTKSRLAEMGLSASQLESILGAMQSQVDLSFSILRRA